MTLQTITTIELANICQLKCRYCIQSKLIKEPYRQLGIMTDEVFDRSLYRLDILCRHNTQAEENLNGNGESLLDPKLVERVRKTKAIMKHRPVGLSSNGILVTRELVDALVDAGLDYLDISPHDAYAARKAYDIIQANGKIRSTYNTGAIVSPHNWAGQLDPEDTVGIRYNIPCHPLIEGRGYISREGIVTPCCYDYKFLGKYGTVFDKTLLQADIQGFILCKTCHQGRDNVH